MIRAAGRFGVWPDGVVAGCVWPVAWVALVAGDFRGWVVSWDQSLEGVNICAFIVWAVVAGVSCARHAQWSRSGAVGYLEAMRGLPVARFTLRYELGFSAGVVVDGVVALAIAAVSSLALGSAPSLVFLPGFCITALGVVCAAVWGGLVGRLWPSYIAAILVAVVVYVGINSGIAGSRALSAFTNYNGLAGSGLQMSTAAAAAFLTLYGGLLVAGLLLAAAREVWRRGPRVMTVVVACVVAGCLAASGLSFHRASQFRVADTILVPAGPSHWDCHTLPSGSTACLTRDLRALDERFDRAMGRLDEFNRAVTGSDADYLYARRPSAVGGHLDGATFFEIGTSPDRPVTSWARSGANWYSRYPTDSDSAARNENADPAACVGAYQAAMGDLSSVLRGDHVAVSDFEQLMGRLAGCDVG